MDTIKVNNITMEKRKVKRLEELVDLVDNAYDYDLSNYHPLIAEIRAITGCKLDDDTIYYEYCSHYCGAHSLSEVVYALINNGEYPDTEEYETLFWKTSDKTDLSNEHIYINFLHRKDETIEYYGVLEDFSLIELLTWIEKQFPHWDKRDNKGSHGVKFLDHYTFDLEENEEYGIEQYIVVHVYHDQMVNVSFKNIDISIRNGLADYMKSLGNTEYYAVGCEINFWKKSGDLTHTDEDIYVAHRFRGDEDSAKHIRDEFETFILDELFSVITEQFPDWVRRDIKSNPDFMLDLDSYKFHPTNEYTLWWQYINIVVYNDNLASVTFNNIEEKDRNIITENMITLGHGVYYNDKNKRYPDDYIFTE